jgi:hypothetical protein
MYWLFRLLPLVVLPLWVTIYIAVSLGSPVSGSPGALLGSLISAAIATCASVLILRVLMRSDLQIRISLRVTWGRFAIFWTILAAIQAVIGVGYRNGTFPSTGWVGWVVLGVAILPGVLAIGALVGGIISAMSWWHSWRIYRNDCRIALLDILLIILHSMRTSSRPLDIERRTSWAAYLEAAAKQLKRDLVSSRLRANLGVGEWLDRRVAGWAEALRHMQREIVAALPGGRQRLERSLCHEIRCLASGDFGALAWRQPPALPPRRVLWWRRSISVIRVIVVAGLPLVSVLAVQLVLHVSTGVFAWERIVAGAWALLYLLISLDPAIREKIDTARALTESLVVTRSIGSGHDVGSRTRPNA